MAAYISFQPTDYFNTKLYTGTGSSNAITGVGFQPDFTWIKTRSNDENHAAYDSVRGVQKTIRPDTDAIQSTDSDGLTAFGADGFTVVSNAKVNTNTYTYASWNWKAGTTTGIAGSSDITPTGYSFNQTSGISIIAYTGNGTGNSTIVHGLGQAPAYVIIKRLAVGVGQWGTKNPNYVDSSNCNVMYLDTNGAVSDDTNVFGTSSAFTSTTFTIGTWSGSNNSGEAYIAYCFAPIKGYSKFGQYTGNANADGPFIFTGFRPAFFMLKGTFGEAWLMYDSKRLGYNNRNDQLIASTNGTEGDTSSWRLDFLSNGVKIKGTDTGVNGSGSNYVYMSFAEFPFVSSNSKPGTAR